MRELYNEFLYIPKHGKIREKVMLTRVATTITIMVICLAAMGMIAYAYFSHNITSVSNTIKAANFETNVSITIKDSNNDSITVTKNGKVQAANLDTGKYIIELTKGDSTAHKGFCVITIGDKTYYTDQIGVDVDKNLENATVKFELRLSSPTQIEILSHWGTSVYYGYKDNGWTEVFIVNGDTVDLTLATQSAGTESSNDTSDGNGGTITTPSTDAAAPTTDAKPVTESTTFSAETNEPTTTTKPNSSETETTTQTTEPADTETTSAEVTTETQPTDETTGAPTAKTLE